MTDSVRAFRPTICHLDPLLPSGSAVDTARALRSTGGVAPSGKALVRALTEPVRARAPRPPAWTSSRREAVNALSEILGLLPPVSAYLVVAVAVLAESILLVAAFIPTLTLLLTAGALRRAETLMTRHGGRAVFLARFLPVVRTLAPHFAGAARRPHRRCALWPNVELPTTCSSAATGSPRAIRLAERHPELPSVDGRRDPRGMGHLGLSLRPGAADVRLRLAGAPPRRRLEPLGGHRRGVAPRLLGVEPAPYVGVCGTARTSRAGDPATR